MHMGMSVRACSNSVQQFGLKHYITEAYQSYNKYSYKTKRKWKVKWKKLKQTAQDLILG